MRYSLKQSIEKIVGERHWRRKLSAEDLVNGWEVFVEQCEAGYPMGIYEYENDLRVRTMIEEVLSMSDLIDDAGMEGFLHKVTEVDKKFRSLLQSGVFIGDDQDSWWNRGVPIHAGNELAADFNEIYGVAVAVVG